MVKAKQTNKNKAFSEAKKNTDRKIKIWAACLDTTKNIWKAYVVDVKNNEIIFASDQKVGQNKAYDSLNDKLTKIKIKK